MKNSGQGFTRLPWPALAPAIIACLFLPGMCKTVAADTAASADTFEILVSNDLADMVKTRPGTFGKEAMDTMPLLEFRDIKFLRYEPSRGVESAFEFMPGVYERLRSRLPRLAMRSFIVYLYHKPVYSGILVNDDASFKYLRTSRYSGPVIILPSESFDDNTFNGLKITFMPQDEIYLRKDDPRGDVPMIWLFKKTGKILF
jgi:hypothetical protein